LNHEHRDVVLLKPYREYYDEYASKVDELLREFPLGAPIIGEQAQKKFIALFGEILRLENILVSFDEFVSEALLTDRQGQDYRSIYLDLYAEFRKEKDADKEQIVDDVVFEIELVKQVEINVDYILMLVEKYRDERGDGDDREIRAEISRAIDASPTLRNKKDLIEDFVDSITVDGEIDREWREFIEARRAAELDEIIASENLRREQAIDFIQAAFLAGGIQTSGTAITHILPPSPRFSPDGAHGAKKQRVIARLTDFFERFFGLSANS
jgi:type I restriction enzyme R subunit